MKPTDVLARLDSIIDRLTKIEITLGSQHVSLDDHIRRTEILEDVVDQDRKEWRKINTHITQVRFLAVLVVLVIGSVGTFIKFH